MTKFLATAYHLLALHPDERKRLVVDPGLCRSAVEETLRYVRVDRGEGRQTEQLFDARDDPQEFRDVAAEQPEALERLRAAADAYRETTPSWGEAPTRELDELELNLLRALGYRIE